MRWPRSLRARLLALFVAGMALSLGLVAVGVVALAEPFSAHLLRAAIEEQAEAVARHVRFDASGQPIGLDETEVARWPFVSLGEEVALRILNDQGEVVYAFDRDPRTMAPDGERFDPGRRAFALAHHDVAMHAATIPLWHGARRWYVQLAFSDRLVLQTRRSIGMPALWRGIVAVCASFLVIFPVALYFALDRAFQPLRTASQVARQITPRTPEVRLDADAQPTEVRPLVDGFNRALDRLQGGLRAQQTFLFNATQRLKTSLTLTRAHVELGPDDERNRRLLQEVDRMSRQVQQLLLLAEVSEPQNLRIESVDPRPTIQDLFAHMEPIAERYAVDLGLRINPGVRQWRTDRSALFSLLKNLLENAIQHSPAGGLVALLVHESGFSVSDEGPGVSAEHLPRIFERFWQGPEQRDEGAGLGLAICEEIARAHGWQLRARCLRRGLEVFAVMDAPDPGDDLSGLHP